MPQTSLSSVTQQPVSATPAPGQVIGTQAPTSLQNSPISAEQADFLRLRRSALSTQLNSAQDRRDDVANQLRDENLSSAERPGLEDRLRVLDDRLAELEREIASNSSQLANAPARSVGASSTRGTGRKNVFEGVNPNLITIFSFSLLMPFAVHLARRMFAPNRGRDSRHQLAESAAMSQRMEKMESALDAVAVEIERVGESQRFLTQALADPQARNRGAIESAAAPRELSGTHSQDATPETR
jgi:hypothetical protein